MLLSLRKNGLTSLFKEVRDFKVRVLGPLRLANLKSCLHYILASLLVDSPESRGAKVPTFIRVAVKVPWACGWPGSGISCLEASHSLTLVRKR